MNLPFKLDYSSSSEWDKKQKQKTSDYIPNQPKTQSGDIVFKCLFKVIPTARPLPV